MSQTNLKQNVYITAVFNNYVYNFYIVMDKTVINKQKSCL